MRGRWGRRGGEERVEAEAKAKGLSVQGVVGGGGGCWGREFAVKSGIGSMFEHIAANTCRKLEPTAQLLGRLLGGKNKYKFYQCVVFVDFCVCCWRGGNGQRPVMLTQ